MEEQSQFMQVKPRTCERCQRQWKWWCVDGHGPHGELEVASSSTNFFQGFIIWKIACQERYIAHYWVPLLPSHLFLPHNMSTPSQYPYSAGKLSGMWNWFGQGQGGQTAGEEGATQHYCLFKWKPRTIRPLMCYNPFDYSHFWLSVNNVLNG